MNKRDPEVIEKLKHALLDKHGYQCEMRLDKGSCGCTVVFQANYLLEEPPNRYAIKILPTMCGERARYSRRELEILEILEEKSFSHTNMVKYYTSWPMKIDSSSFIGIRMELCRLNLFAFIRHNNMGGSEVIKIQDSPRFYERVFPQILDGLRFIHSKGWVHRDIHPGNILIANPNPEQIVDIIVKIADFGLARKIVDAQLTLSNATKLEELSPNVGNELFRAPELKTKDYDYKADLYSAGVVLYFISTYLEDKSKWKEEIEAFKDGNRDSSCLFHRDDKYLVSLIQQLMKGKDQRPTAEKALEIAKDIGKFQGKVDTQRLVEPKGASESTDGGNNEIKRSIIKKQCENDLDEHTTGTLDLSHLATALPESIDNHQSQELTSDHDVQAMFQTTYQMPRKGVTETLPKNTNRTKVIYVRKNGELESRRCLIQAGISTLSGLKAEIERCIGIKAECQKLTQQTIILGAEMIGIKSDEDVQLMF